MTPANDPNSMAYPPRPLHPWTANVWEEQRIRRRLMEGTWARDLTDALYDEMSIDRADMQGQPDLSSNTARDVWVQSAALYTTEPGVGHVDEDAPPEVHAAMRAVLDAVEWVPTMDAAQPMILAQREGVILCRVIKADKDAPPQLRILFVPIDLVEMEPHPYDPTRVAVLRIYALQCVDHVAGRTKGETVWTRETWDIRDPAKPAYSVVIVSDNKGNPAEKIEDITDSYSGLAAYPWVYQGAAYIPAVLYHARRGLGRLLDPFYGVELVRGSLSAAVYTTMWRHAFRDVSWPQRNAIDLEPAGGVQTSTRTPNVATVDADMASIMKWKSKGDKNGSLFQFESGADPIALMNAIENYRAGLVTSYGISPTDVQRVAADPRSGYAIALSREGVRKEIARYRGAFSASDRELLSVLARMANTWLGMSLPVDGWTVDYRGLPKSDAEIKQEIDNARNAVEMGIASPVDLYMTANGVDRQTAIKRLERIASDRAMVQAFAQTAGDVWGTAPAPQDDPADPAPPENPAPEDMNDGT